MVIVQIEFNQVQDSCIDLDRAFSCLMIDRHQIVDAGVLVVNIK